MGNQPAQDPRTYFQNDLPNFIYQDRIGNGKFMKTYIVKVKGVPFVVKVYMKTAEENLQSVSLELSHLWKTISPSRYPNLLPYQMWIKSAKPTRNNVYPVYLIRQYMQSSLHDRLSTRPFLTPVEKLWLMYQLFKALEVCHMSHGIIHGDIKPENVLLSRAPGVAVEFFPRISVSDIAPVFFFVPHPNATLLSRISFCSGLWFCHVAGGSAQHPHELSCECCRQARHLPIHGT